MMGERILTGIGGVEAFMVLNVDQDIVGRGRGEEVLVVTVVVSRVIFPQS